jgi:hypothetical protein
MYVNTENEYLFYKVNGNIYRVPTHGKLFKIIDFGRGIFEMNGTRYCSDCFEKGNDASTQYNTEPFYTSKRIRIDPNKSFDLCRLGCSMIDIFIKDESDFKASFKPETIKNKVFRLVCEWCLDDNNKSIIYHKNGEEKYPDFLLYKKIARNVHNHIPLKQLERPEFLQFLYTEQIDKSLIINIDNIPCFA